MRTSTLLAVLAALMLLVACAAPVFGQSSSSSTGESSSSSSAATIIASSSSSTGSSNNNNTVAASSSSSSGATSGNSVVGFTFPLFPISFIQGNQTLRTTVRDELTREIAAALQINSNQVQISDAANAWAANANGGSVVFATITSVSNAVTLLNNVKSGSNAFQYPLIATATIQNQGDVPIAGPNSASTLSFGFAAVAVVLAALLQ